MPPTGRIQCATLVIFGTFLISSVVLPQLVSRLWRLGHPLQRQGRLASARGHYVAARDLLGFSLPFRGGVLTLRGAKSGSAAVF